MYSAIYSGKEVAYFYLSFVILHGAEQKKNVFNHFFWKRSDLILAFPLRPSPAAVVF